MDGTERTSPRSGPLFEPSGPGRRLLALQALTLALLILSAWLHDDAFITFRTVENVLEGRGLVWNVAERVQAFTHPLWLSILTAGAASSIDVLDVALGVSFVATMLAIHLVATRVASGPIVGLAAAALLLVSKAFLDYSASGLEDPLTRLLLVIFVLIRLRDDDRPGRFVGLGAASAGIALCRPDAFLIVVPSLVAVLRSGRSRFGRAVGLATGLLPLLAWGAFAAFYYGSFVPNTALAKLGHGLPRTALVVQGLGYLVDSLSRDPITLATILGSTALVVRHRRPVAVPLVVGAWLYLAWIVWIGGDHMSGRFLGLPFLAAVLALSRSPLRASVARRRAVPALVALLLLMVPRGIGPLVQREIGWFGVADEIRGFHPSTGLIHRFLGGPWPDHGWREIGERAAAAGPSVRVTGAAGMMGYYGGPAVHWVDRFALCDPLLARLPARLPDDPMNSPGKVSWRPGHLERPLPVGYLESLERDANLLEDRQVAGLYERIRTVTRGPLGEGDRIRAAFALALERAPNVSADR